MAERDDFSSKQKEILARRAGGRCSNPGCGVPTFGPQMDPERALNLGVAAHISAAASRGPRYEAAMSNMERRSLQNAVWLCQRCAKLIDNDPVRFPVSILKQWKILAEEAAFQVVATQTGTHDERSSTATLNEPGPLIRTHCLRVPQRELASCLAAHLRLGTPRGFRFVEEGGDLVPFGSHLELEGSSRISISWDDIRSAVNRACGTLAAPLLADGFVVSAFVAKIGDVPLDEYTVEMVIVGMASG